MDTLLRGLHSLVHSVEPLNFSSFHKQESKEGHIYYIAEYLIIAMINGMIKELKVSKPVIYNESRKTVKVTVKNTGDRPCQIGSHTHFFKVNRALDFPSKKAFGFRLNIPAGTSVRFEPGDSKEVELCELGGSRVVHGFNALVMGGLNMKVVKNTELEKAKTKEKSSNISETESKNEILKLTQLEDKISKNKINKNDLEVIDGIRIKTLAMKSDMDDTDRQVSEKSRNLLLNYFDKRFDDLSSSINRKGTEDIKDNREKMRLFHLKFRIKQNDSRNLDDIEKEFLQFRSDAEETIKKLLPSFTPLT